MHRNEWPQLRASAAVSDAIKTLRIVTEDRKLEHGYSSPLILDDNYELLGFVHLAEPLNAVRHVCFQPGEPCKLDKAAAPIRELVRPFVAVVEKDDDILKALDIVVDNIASLVPVMREGKLKGLIKLSDIFNTVSALLFDEPAPEERGRLVKHFHW